MSYLSYFNKKRINSRGAHSAVILFVVVLVLLFGAVLYTFMANLSKHPSLTKNTAKITATADDANTVTVWSWNIAAQSLQELVPAFNKQYPNIRVKVVTIPHDNANDKFRLAIHTGTGFPDVWQSEANVTPEYIHDGALLDITDRAAKYQNDFVGYKWAEVTHAGKVYALPWDSAPVGLFYRRDIFEKAGVDPNSIQTWDDYIAAGKKITHAPNQYMTFMSNSSAQGIRDTFEILLALEGGSVFDADGNPTFNSSQGLAAVTLMKKIYDAKITANIAWYQPSMFDAIKSGEIASFAQGVWMGGQIKKTAPTTSGQWGVIPVPAAFPGGLRTATRGGSTLAIPAKSKHHDAAWKFIEFAMANKDSQLQMYNKHNLFPSWKATYTDPVFTAPDPFYANQVISHVFVPAQDSLPGTYYYGLRYYDSLNIINKEVLQAINNQKTPAQALIDADKEVKALVIQ